MASGEFFAIFILLIILIIYDKHKTIYDYFSSNNIVADYDKKSYRVCGGFANNNKAADRLAKVHEFIIQYLKFVKKKFIINRIGPDHHIKFFQRMLSNYNPDNIFENCPSKGEDTSFVSNKGSQFGMCLRKQDPHRNKFHGMSILKFVILHELTHLGCSTYGHGAEFWQWFKVTLTQAVASKLYKPVDYSKYPDNYCGLNLNSNPYCDGNNNCD